MDHLSDIRWVQDLAENILDHQLPTWLKPAEYGFGEHGFKHRTQWVFLALTGLRGENSVSSVQPIIKISVFTLLHRNAERIKVTQKWLKSGSGRPTPKWPKIDSKVTQDPIFESISSHFWVISSHSGVGPQESLLSHFFVTLILSMF